jgi:nicotinamide-nucleotide amidase
MALSVKQIMKSDYAIATTGNTGPSKEIQMLKWDRIHRNCNTSSLIVEEFNFGQPREKVIDRAV